MDRVREQRIVCCVLIILGTALLVLALLTGVAAGGADNYAHYNISRWAFRYPHLFLDHWGKPVFSILSAPFAQLGFTGVRIFNILAGLLTAWFGYKLTKFFNLKFSWFSVIGIIFTPLYLVMMSSGMTEILFSLFLVLSIYLFFKEKYVFSALVISFIFLIRNEGLVFLLMFLAAFLLRKQYRAIPFLMTGFLLFSLIGGFYHYHDFLWLINSRPYALDSGPSVYGHGSWDHFFTSMPEYLGNFLPFLLIGGSLLIVINWIRKRFTLKGNDFFFMLLILGSFWGYFAIHSYLWWRTETSAGLTRVMAAVTPLIPVIALYGFNTLWEKIPWKPGTGILMLLLSCFLVADGSLYYRKVLSADPASKTRELAARWLKTSGNLKYKLVVHDPYFAFSSGLDPWDKRVIQYGFLNNDFPEKEIPDSAIFIWDAHFSANEGRLPLEKILHNPHFEAVQLFEPEIPFVVQGGNDFRIVIFRKSDSQLMKEVMTVRDLQERFTLREIYHREEMDFQHPLVNPEAEKNRKMDGADSLNFMYDLEGREFSPAFVVATEKVRNVKNNKIRIFADIFRSGYCQPKRVLMVFSVEKEGQSAHYLTSDICEKSTAENIWGTSVTDFDVPPDLPEGHILKIYVWNLDKSNIKIDNFIVELSEVNKVYDK